AATTIRADLANTVNNQVARFEARIRDDTENERRLEVRALDHEMTCGQLDRADAAVASEVQNGRVGESEFVFEAGDLDAGEAERRGVDAETAGGFGVALGDAGPERRNQRDVVEDQVRHLSGNAK